MARYEAERWIKIINVEQLAVNGYGKISNGESFLKESEQNQTLFWVTV